MIALCYGAWMGLVIYGDVIYPVLWVIACGVILTLFWSLIHEVVHGHPTVNQTLNRLLVVFPIGWVFPYERFRETHLEHHDTGKLTDPFDDPESWYLTTSEWMLRSRLAQYLLQFNNTLFGRMLIGPLISLTRFYGSEIKLTLSRKPEAASIVVPWAVHLLLCGMIVVFLVQFSSVYWWQHALAAYVGVSFLLVRTFLEHQANENHEERTVIIEKSCPIAFLFLFNNLHFVHHSYPGIPWYQLPGVYNHNRAAFLEQNNGYVYSSYLQILPNIFFA